MGVLLLDKTRKIGSLLHNNISTKVVFNDICRVLTECLSSNVLVLSVKGKVLGKSICDDVPEMAALLPCSVGTFIDPLQNERLLSILSTKENVNLETLGFEETTSAAYRAMINPIEIAGERLGTIFVYRVSPEYDIDDIIVSEYGTTVVGLEITRSESEETVEEKRRLSVVVSALSTLSQTEKDAVRQIFYELDGNEGIIVASKVADRAGITRSVIVNALRKLESAGVIESRSSGMKGTYLKILNDKLPEELQTSN